MIFQNVYPFKLFSIRNNGFPNSEPKSVPVFREDLNKNFYDIRQVIPLIDSVYPNFSSENDVNRSIISSLKIRKNNQIDNLNKEEYNPNIYFKKEENTFLNKKLIVKKCRDSKLLKKSQKLNKSQLKEECISKKNLIKLTTQSLFDKEISINLEVINKPKPLLIDAEIQLGDFEMQHANKEGQLIISSLDPKNKCHFCAAILKNKESLGGHISRNHKNMIVPNGKIKDKIISSDRKRSRTRLLLANIQYYKQYEDADFRKERSTKNFKKNLSKKREKQSFVKN